MFRLLALVPIVPLVAIIAAGSRHRETVPPAAERPLAVPEQPARNTTVLMAFNSRSCEPCMAMEPILHDLADEGQAVQFIDVDTHPGIKRAWQVRKTPTYIAVKNGKELGRIVGATTRSALEKLVHYSPAKAKQPEIPPAIVDPATEPTEKPPVIPPATVPRPANWRLRLLYPRGDLAGERLRKIFEGELVDLAREYRFVAITTDSQEFEAWQPFGYPEDGVTLVLIRPDRSQAYLRHYPSHDKEQLAAEIRAAASAKARMQSTVVSVKDCTCRPLNWRLP